MCRLYACRKIQQKINYMDTWFSTRGNNDHQSKIEKWIIREITGT